jgi:fatty acid/phospholipid biosynthesis enzyme
VALTLGARSSPAKRTSTITTTTDSLPQEAPSSSAQETVVAVDANGADLGPAEVAAGAALAAARGVRVLLFGPAQELRGAQGLAGADHPGIEIVDAPRSIAKSADPARAVRAAPDSSIVQAARAVAQGRAQALVCAGGTGAAIAAGLFNIKRARGIHRPALALALPVPDPQQAGRYRPVVLLDVGANAQARREHLVQFAYMGAALAEVVLGVSCPRVALLSNGEEAQRGSPLVLEAHAELAQRLAVHVHVVAPAHEAAPAHEGAVTHNVAGTHDAAGTHGVAPAHDAAGRHDAAGTHGVAPAHDAAGTHDVAGTHGVAPAHDAAGRHDAAGTHDVAGTHDAATVNGGGAQAPFELIGNVEGGGVVAGAADVVVTDGFTGNVALKLIEGVSQTMIDAIRAAAMSSSRAQLGGLLLRPALRAFREQIDPEAQGGAYLLGLRSLGVVPHGRFSRRGFAEAIVRAQCGAREDLVGRTYAALAQAGALRSAPVSSLGE